MKITLEGTDCITGEYCNKTVVQEASFTTVGEALLLFARALRGAGYVPEEFEKLLNE